MIKQIKSHPVYRHYFPAGLVTGNSEPVRVLMVGAGGNGGPMITGLARMDAALKALWHPGINLNVADGDTISAANVGRQLYSKADIGRNKAECLVSRVNIFFGLTWQAHPTMLTRDHLDAIAKHGPQIIITAVDNVKAREIVHRAIHRTNTYWLDMGNGKSSGQVMLGTGYFIKQPAKQPNCIGHLPTILDLYPDLKKTEKSVGQGPSCSVAQALEKQDLFVNTAVSTFALDLLWKAFRQGYIEYHGCYINLDTFKVTPMAINPAYWEQKGWDPYETKEKAA